MKYSWKYEDRDVTFVCVEKVGGRATGDLYIKFFYELLFP
jgi:hypothetical protein